MVLGDLRTYLQVSRQPSTPSASLVSALSEEAGGLSFGEVGTMRPSRAEPGTRWGRLVVIAKLPGSKRLCRCDCGGQSIVVAKNLSTGNTKSCGCQQMSGCARTSWLGGSELEKHIGELSLMWELMSVPRYSDLAEVRCVICGYERHIERKTWPYQAKCKRCRSLRAIVDDEELASLPTLVDARGYARFICGKHDLRGCGSNGAILAHRLIMERHIGRPLESHEIVHHIDGNRLNNDPENLSLLPSMQAHMALHRGGMHRRPLLYRESNGRRFSVRFGRKWQYMETCGCGCGAEFPAFVMYRGDSHAYLRQFVSGHSTKWRR